MQRCCDLTASTEKMYDQWSRWRVSPVSRCGQAVASEVKTVLRGSRAHDYCDGFEFRHLLTAEGSANCGHVRPPPRFSSPSLSGPWTGRTQGVCRLVQDDNGISDDGADLELSHPGADRRLSLCRAINIISRP